MPKFNLAVKPYTDATEYHEEGPRSLATTIEIEEYAPDHQLLADYTEDEVLYYAKIYAAGRKRMDYVYLWGYEILTVNGQEVPEEFLVKDTSPGRICHGDTLLVRHGYTNEDFGFTVVK